MLDRFVSFNAEGTDTGLPPDVEDRLDEHNDRRYATPASVAADLANPESASNSAIVAVVESAVPAGVLPWVDATASLAAPRPAGYSGPVVWILPAGTSLPINRAAGDFILRRSETVVEWSPAQLANLAAWYDAQAITAAADSPVAQWDDLSGHGRHQVQSTTTAQPTYRAAGLNGHPSVQFDGTADYLAATIESYTGAWTVYLVAQSIPATLTGGSDFIIGGAGASNPSQRLDIYRTTSNTVAATRGTALTGPALDNGVHRIRAVFNGANSAIQIDAGTPIAGTTPLSGVDIVKLTLGARADAANWLDGHLGEVIYVQGTVTAEDDAKIAAYLQTRWGVA